MFQFTSFPLLTYVFNQQCVGINPTRVSPFGNPRI